MRLSPYQWEAVAFRMGLLGIEPAPYKTVLTCRLSERQLMGMAKKVPTPAEPEEHFVWARSAKQHLGSRRRKLREGRDELLSEMYLRGVGATMEELDFWLNQFCNAILWHLLNRETPIDLYFCKLHPSPYRLDWRAKFGPDGHRRKRSLETPWRIAWDGRTCLRSIDFEHTRLWWRVARRVERDRLKLLGDKLYAAEYMGWIQRRLKESERMQHEWLEACRAPFPDLMANVKGQPRRFTARKYRSAKLIARADQSLGRAELESRERKEAEHAARKVATDRHMRAMRLISSRVRGRGYMWKARRALLESGNGKTGTPGVLVPHAPEGEPEQSNVLDAGSGYFTGRVV
jgi:hypothetical protein